MALPKIYGFNNGGNEGWMSAEAIAQDGTHLAGHICSNESFMRHDLGMDGESERKHDKYKAHYPDGFVTEFVSYKDVPNHQGLQAALALHSAKNSAKAQGEEAGVSRV